VEGPDSAGGAGRQSIRVDGAIDYQMPMIHRNLRQGIAPDRVILQSGMSIGQRGAQIGQLHDLLAEVESGRISHLTLRRGLLQREQIVVPIDYFTLVADSPIQRQVPLVSMGNLPHYRQPNEEALLVNDESDAFARVYTTMLDGSK